MIALWAWVGCGPPPASSSAGERWVSLAPQITETVAALGAADLLVGRSDYCALPADVARLPPVGTALTPNLEAVASLRPTLALVERAPSTRDVDLAGVVRVEALPWLTVDDLVASTRRVGALAGRAAEADRWVATYERTLRPDPPQGGPRVLLALTADPSERGEIWFLKRNSLHGAALHAAGARNAVDRDVEVPVLSIEAALASDPDAILVLAPVALADDDRARIVAAWGVLSPARAVRAGDIAAIGGPEILSTGPSIATLAERIGAALAELGVQ